MASLMGKSLEFDQQNNVVKEETMLSSLVRNEKKNKTKKSAGHS